MTLDHAGAFLLDDQWLRVVGRFAAPMFCFLVGFNGSYRFRKELLIAAILMSGVEALCLGGIKPLNILWSILFARLALQLLEKHPVPPLMLAGACLLWLPGTILFLDYGMLVLLWALWGQAVARGDARGSLYYMIAASVGGVLYNLVGFTWTEPQVVVVIGIFILVAVMLQRFTLRPVAVTSRPLHWLSHHALAYYVAHRSAMIGYDAMLGT